MTAEFAVPTFTKNVKVGHPWHDIMQKRNGRESVPKLRLASKERTLTWGAGLFFPGKNLDPSLRSG